MNRRRSSARRCLPRTRRGSAASASIDSCDSPRSISTTACGSYIHAARSDGPPPPPSPGSFGAPLVDLVSVQVPVPLGKRPHVLVSTASSGTATSSTSAPDESAASARRMVSFPQLIPNGKPVAPLSTVRLPRPAMVVAGNVYRWVSRGGSFERVVGEQPARQVDWVLACVHKLDPVRLAIHLVEHYRRIGSRSRESERGECEQEGWKGPGGAHPGESAPQPSSASGNPPAGYNKGGLTGAPPATGGSPTCARRASAPGRRRAGRAGRARAHGDGATREAGPSWPGAPTAARTSAARARASGDVRGRGSAAWSSGRRRPRSG